MSINTPAPHHDNPTGHDHLEPHGSMKGYLTGFILSVILTAVPFWLVMDHVITSPGWTTATILFLAAVQIFVHMVYFLHMNTRSEGGWSMLALIFTLVMVIITLSGSIWVMYHLNANMMPMTPAMAESAP
jgi:cytochrome o ubiquinol oxidase operon protein cyoD